MSTLEKVSDLPFLFARGKNHDRVKTSTNLGKQDHVIVSVVVQ